MILLTILIALYGAWFNSEIMFLTNNGFGSIQLLGRHLIARSDLRRGLGRRAILVSTTLLLPNPLAPLHHSGLHKPGLPFLEALPLEFLAPPLNPHLPLVLRLHRLLEAQRLLSGPHLLLQPLGLRHRRLVVVF